MKNTIRFLRTIAIFIAIIGIFLKMQGFSDGDNLIKGGMLFFCISILFWVIALIRRGKGAY